MRRALIAATLALSGCSLHAMTGDMMSEYTVEHMGPYLVGTSDLGMACETGISMTSYLLSFGRVTDHPDKAAISGLLSAGACAQTDAWEAALRGARALKVGDSASAQDARIAEKRAHAVAARRFYRAWGHLVAHFGEPGGKCPKLDEPQDEINYLLGLLAGVQAVQHDRAASGVVGVPLDVPRKAARATACLKNEKWWGAPKALQAAVWLGVPGATPDGADPWAQLAEARTLGEKAGVRLAHAVYAHAADAAGRADEVKKAIEAYVVARDAQPAPDKWRLLDENAGMQIEVLSDRLWTQATGHRTPHGALGTFPGADAPEADEGLLGDLVEEEAPAEQEKPADAQPTEEKE